MSVIVDPIAPYIALPRSSCDAIAAQLPVNFQEDYGLYFWDTGDSKYTKIVTSASNLTFRLRKDSSNTQSIDINVPFVLLSLTLEYPLVSQPTQYFPCMPTNGTYGLGRAFLQAAFVGVNWGDGVGSWFLAQAPGPNFPTTPSTAIIPAHATQIPGSKDSWEETWDGHWDVLSAPDPKETEPAASKHATNDSNGSEYAGGAGLSKGGKAGIGIGRTIAGMILIAIVVVILRRRRRQDATSNNAPSDTETKPDEPDTAESKPDIETGKMHELDQRRRNWHRD